MPPGVDQAVQRRFNRNRSPQGTIKPTTGFPNIPINDHGPVMEQRTKAAGLGGVIGIIGFLAMAAVVGLLVVYTGGYNIAATEEHASIVRWAFDTTFRNSIKNRAADLQAPASFTPDMVAAGATSYKQMCQHCHAGPGVKRAEWASGMRPRPPHLKEAAAEWEAKEIYWLVKHGAKMTGMPAFGPSHDDEALWSIAAFVKELPAMTPERYATLGEAKSGDTPSTSGHSQH
jgi:mono/diheme cytochrome c family protein